MIQAQGLIIIYFNHHFSKDSDSLLAGVSNYLPSFEEYISNLYFFIVFGVIHFSLIPIFSLLSFKLKKYFFGLFGYGVILSSSFYLIFLIKKWGIWNMVEILSTISFSLLLYFVFYFMFYLQDKIANIIFSYKRKKEINVDVIEYILKHNK